MNHQHSAPFLGVLGGLGPLATVYYLDLLNRMTEIHREQDHLDMLIYNLPSTPDRTAWLLGASAQSPVPGMVKALRAMEDQGVTAVAIPCMTAHCFLDTLQGEVEVPIIDGVGETVRCLKEAGVTAAGILATSGTIATGLFTQALESAGIRPVKPDEKGQRDIMGIIYGDIKAEKAVDMERFGAVSRQLREKGAEAIILGCTELSLIKRDYLIGPGYLDTLEVLARAALLRCGKTVKESYQGPLF